MLLWITGLRKCITDRLELIFPYSYFYPSLFDRLSTTFNMWIKDESFFLCVKYKLFIHNPFVSETGF